MLSEKPFQKVYIEQRMQLTRTQTGRAMFRCLSRHWSLTFCTLNSFKLCTHQWMCSSSDTPAFRSFFHFISFIQTPRMRDGGRKIKSKNALGRE